VTSIIVLYLFFNTIIMIKNVKVATKSVNIIEV